MSKRILSQGRPERNGQNEISLADYIGEAGRLKFPVRLFMLAQQEP